MTINGRTVLLEQDAGILSASFVQHHTVYEVATTLPQAAALTVIERLPLSYRHTRRGTGGDRSRAGT
ncbi:MAG: hypothetical protein MI924_17410 [Chloroflexales bacterium]|nr:hypothetical protein [Chloroflexales bacterium]